MLIRTKIIPATNTTGTKVRASFGGRIKTIPYPYELSFEQVYKQAAWEWVKHHLTRHGWDDPSRFTLTTHYCYKKGYSFEVNAKQN